MLDPGQVVRGIELAAVEAVQEDDDRLPLPLGVPQPVEVCTAAERSELPRVGRRSAQRGRSRDGEQGQAHEQAAHLSYDVLGTG
jgi:hypothetical protein